MKASEHGIPFVPEWYWSQSDNAERWTNGPFSDKDAAIRDGEANADGPFYVGSASEPDVTFPDADSVIERASLCLYDECGEGADDCFEADDAARAELDAELARVFAAWLTKHSLWPTCGLIENIERIEQEPAETT